MKKAEEPVKAAADSSPEVKQDRGDVGELKKKWNLVLDGVRKKVGDLVPFLEMVDISALNGNCVELTFPNTPENMKLYRKALRNQVLIQDIINKTFNKSYIVSIRPGSAGAPGPAAAEEHGSAGGTEAGDANPILGEIINLFDAEVVEQKRATQTPSTKEENNE